MFISEATEDGRPGIPKSIHRVASPSGGPYTGKVGLK